MKLYTIIENYRKELEQNAQGAQTPETPADCNKYANMLSALLDSRAVISNQMLCALLRTPTESWKYTVRPNLSQNSVTLVFESSKGEHLKVMRAISATPSTPLNIDYHAKRLQNVNWFNIYLTSRAENGNIIYKSPTHNVAEVMPKRIQTVLENFFKAVEVDENHPEHLCLTPKAPVQPYKQKNFAYIVARDRKKQQALEKNSQNTPQPQNTPQSPEK